MKISILIKEIDRTSWFIAATAGTEEIPYFTGVVKKINHELAKQFVNNPNFNRSECRIGPERSRIIHDILYAPGTRTRRLIQKTNVAMKQTRGTVIARMTR